MSSLKQRSSFGIPAVILLLGFIYIASDPFWGFLFPAFVSLLAGFGLWEYYEIAKAKQYHPISLVGIIGAVAYILSLPFSQGTGFETVVPVLILGCTTLISFLCFFYRSLTDQPLGNMAITLFGLLYVAIPLGCGVQIINFFPVDGVQDGRIWLLYVVAVSKLTDTGAYFLGKAYGKHLLAPQISPKKTIEGSVAGMITALIASLLFSGLMNPDLFSLSWRSATWLGLVIGALAQLGDLAESLFKRDAGVKDSNRLPGLGGILDMIDSITFTFPFLYFYLFLHYELHL